MIYDLFQAINNESMKDINNSMNDIMNGKTGHNIMNDIEQLCISQTVYLLLILYVMPLRTNIFVKTELDSHSSCMTKQFITHEMRQIMGLQIIHSSSLN